MQKSATAMKTEARMILVIFKSLLELSEDGMSHTALYTCSFENITDSRQLR